MRHLQVKPHQPFLLSPSSSGSGACQRLIFEELYLLIHSDLHISQFLGVWVRHSRKYLGLFLRAQMLK
jgi:hypothetical protein